MRSELLNAENEIRKLYNKKRSNGETTTLDKCRNEYSKLMNSSNWETYKEHLKAIDKENKICKHCFNKPLFNPLSVCPKCSNRYNENGDIINAE